MWRPGGIIIWASAAAMVLFIIAAATAFGFALALLEVPAAMGALIGVMTDNPILTLLIINLMLLALAVLWLGTRTMNLHTRRISWTSVRRLKTGWTFLKRALRLLTPTTSMMLSLLQLVKRI